MKKKRLLTILAGIIALCVLATTAPTGVGVAQAQSSDPDYDRHLTLIRSQTVRNRNLDGRPEARLTQAQLDVSRNSPQFGPRSDYLGVPNGNPSHSVPSRNVGNFRVGCEFSHFAYDDPILYPGEPGRAHLHMFFGNTDVNAYSTVDTLKNSGSSTCNGQELNRTGYWAPAMIDGDGNARIPERVIVYYKGYGKARGNSLPYADGMANISPSPLTVPEIPVSEGGGRGTNRPQVNFKCSNNRSLNPTTPDQMGINSIPTCSGDDYAGLYPEYRAVLEMDVKFWNCFDTTADATDYAGWEAGDSQGWFGSSCSGDTYPNLEYFINYVVEPGEDTSEWYLASDIDPATIGGTPALRGQRGGTHHADWWGAWHPRINKLWLDNCVNYDPGDTDGDGLTDNAGCGNGYLSDGGPDLRPNGPPRNGLALKYREQFDTQIGNSRYYKVPVSQLFAELCTPLNPGHRFTTAASGAWCKPNGDVDPADPVRVSVDGSTATVTWTLPDDPNVNGSWVMLDTSPGKWIKLSDGTSITYDLSPGDHYVRVFATRNGASAVLVGRVDFVIDAVDSGPVRLIDVGRTTAEVEWDLPDDRSVRGAIIRVDGTRVPGWFARGTNRHVVRNLTPGSTHQITVYSTKNGRSTEIDTIAVTTNR